jgi:hypothetical protein
VAAANGEGVRGAPLGARGLWLNSEGRGGAFRWPLSQSRGAGENGERVIAVFDSQALFSAFLKPRRFFANGPHSQIDGLT